MTINIRPTLKRLQQFISTCRNEPTSDRYALFSSIFNMEKESIDTMEFMGMTKVTTPVDQLEKQLQAIHHLRFEELIHDTLQKLISTYCPNQTASAVLYLLDEEDTFGREKLGGVSAFAEYDGELTFIVYPDEKVRPTLESVITHEFHHFWRIGLINITEENETLLDKLVLEGLAELFVGYLLGSKRQGPMIHALEEEQARDLWVTQFSNHIHLKGDETNPWMFGGENGLPTWAGYSMGYHLVKWYCTRHPNLTIEELTQLPSKAFVK
jgi:uncharacterized protein YjaZ